MSSQDKLIKRYKRRYYALFIPNISLSLFLQRSLNPKQKLELIPYQKHEFALVKKKKNQKIIPLDFWFNRHNHKPVEVNQITLWLLQSLIELANDINRLCELQKSISEYHHSYVRQNYNWLSLDCGRSYHSPYSILLNDITEKIEKLDIVFSEKIIMSHDEIVNGYHLYDCNINICAYGDFVNYKKMYQENKEMSFEEFHEKFDDMACSDWSKMDDHGECFGGFWQAAEGTYEREHAYELSREDNCKKL